MNCTYETLHNAINCILPEHVPQESMDDLRAILQKAAIHAFLHHFNEQDSPSVILVKEALQELHRCGIIVFNTGETKWHAD